MPKSLEKTRKQIAKKRNGTVEALHQYSRDSKRLHRAQVRDERLEKLATSRRRQEQPFLDRVSHFKAAIADNGSLPLDMDSVQAQIKSFVQQYDDEYNSVTKARRPGRPASAREDMLKLKISTLQKEYEHGFLLPDLTSVENASLLDRWEGSWAYLTTLAWVRVSKSGGVRTSSFPPKGDH